MVPICILVVVLAASYCLWRLARHSSSQHYGWRKVWRVAVLIGTVRVAALWLGAAAYRNPGWLQGFGCLLQMLALPEIYLARSIVPIRLNGL